MMRARVRLRVREREREREREGRSKPVACPRARRRPGRRSR